MFIKNFLKPFSGDMPVKLYFDDGYLTDAETVADVMNNGLFNYLIIKSASIIDGVLTIITY